MQQTTILVPSLAELPQAANTCLDFCKNDRIFAFYGNMGVGKTTFIKAICQQLGVKDIVSSPTYALVNEYLYPDPSTSTPTSIYHLDLYRLKDLEETLAIGIEEYLLSGQYCFIEWPQIIEPLFDQVVKLQLNLDQHHQRLITISKP